MLKARKLMIDFFHYRNFTPESFARHSGLNERTVKKIIHGEKIQERSLEKFRLGLNLPNIPCCTHTDYLNKLQ